MLRPSARASVQPGAAGPGRPGRRPSPTPSARRRPAWGRQLVRRARSANRRPVSRCPRSHQSSHSAQHEPAGQLALPRGPAVARAPPPSCPPRGRAGERRHRLGAPVVGHVAFGQGEEVAGVRSPGRRGLVAVAQLRPGVLQHRLEQAVPRRRRCTCTSDCSTSLSSGRGRRRRPRPRRPRGRSRRRTRRAGGTAAARRRRAARSSSRGSRHRALAGRQVARAAAGHGGVEAGHQRCRARAAAPSRPPARAPAGCRRAGRTAARRPRRSPRRRRTRAPPPAPARRTARRRGRARPAPPPARAARRAADGVLVLAAHPQGARLDASTVDAGAGLEQGAEVGARRRAGARGCRPPAACGRRPGPRDDGARVRTLDAGQRPPRGRRRAAPATGRSPPPAAPTRPR